MIRILIAATLLAAVGATTALATSPAAKPWQSGYAAHHQTAQKKPSKSRAHHASSHPKHKATPKKQPS